MKEVNKLVFFGLAGLLGFSTTIWANGFTDNEELSFHERAKNLVSQMTLDEKVNQLKNNVGAINRLGIPKYNYWNEGIHGVARSGEATSFPISKGLSSMWDAPLMYKVAYAISDEARVYNNETGKGLTYWCPTINMSRDPRWGRDEENYGEDPYLTGRLAVEFIKGLQGAGDNSKHLKTVATAKHFAANNYEKERRSHSSDMDEQDFRDYYLPAFEMCVKEGKVASIMSAYNAINGVPCTANEKLLTNILRKEWGFDGFVTSDCGGVGFLNTDHHYANSSEDAITKALQAGNDMNCNGDFAQAAKNAISNGTLKEAEVDSALVRIFESRFRLGEFDEYCEYRDIDRSKLNCKEHQDLALQAAHESIVLLKNQAPADSETPLLPLDPTKKVAVIGSFANYVNLGGYSGTPVHKSSLYQALADRFGIDISDNNLQFENFDEKSGNLRSEANGCDGNIGNVKAGDWVKFNQVDFGSGCSIITFTSATANGADKPTVMKVYIDNMDGEAAATITLPSTGGWNNYKESTFDIDASLFTGVHDIYFEFSGGNTFCSNMDWFRFGNYEYVKSTVIQSYEFDGVKGSAKRDEANKDGLVTNLGNIKNGDLVWYSNVNFSNGFDKLEFEFATNNKNQKSTIEFYLDSPEGEPVLTVSDLAYTGGWQTYETIEKDLNPELFKGMHTLYLKFSVENGATYCGNLKTIKFYDSSDSTPDEEEVEVDDQDQKLFYARCCNVKDKSGTDIATAQALAKKADVVIFTAGTDTSVMNEGLDRTTLALPGDQQKVLEAIYDVNPNVILVIESASSHDVTWANENVPAILEAWYAGQAQGEAIADVLYGDFNPSGKLTSTWYGKDSDLNGDITDYNIRSRKLTYMYYDKAPLYPFGYGLSYTQFEYSNLQLSSDFLDKDSEIEVSFEVKNVGDRAGAEVVQLYTSNRTAEQYTRTADVSTLRPIKELKGFERVELEPGETKGVTIKLRHDQLRHYNPQTKTYDVDDANVKLMVGASSSDIRLTGSFKSKGAIVQATYETDPVVTGINSIVDDNASGVSDVYTIDGFHVKDLETAAPSIYIVNGRKVVK